MELYGLADADLVGDGQGAGLPVQAHDVADQEVPPPERVPVLVDHPPDVQALAEEGLLALAEGGPEFLQLLQRGLAAEFEDDVALGPGDEQVPADGPAGRSRCGALRH